MNKVFFKKTSRNNKSEEGNMQRMETAPAMPLSATSRLINTADWAVDKQPPHRYLNNLCLPLVQSLTSDPVWPNTGLRFFFKLLQLQSSDVALIKVRRSDTKKYRSDFSGWKVLGGPLTDRTLQSEAIKSESLKVGRLKAGRQQQHTKRQTESCCAPVGRHSDS